MTDDRVLMGIDLGTTGAKGVLVTLRGDILAQHETHYGFDIPRPGWAEHDADQAWWGSVCTISRALLAQVELRQGQLAGVGCSAIAPTMLPLDAAFRPLRPAILYGIDTRAAREIDELTEQFGTERIFERTGQFLSAQSVGPKVAWYRRHEPELYARTAKVVTATSYLTYRLTGRFVVDNYTAPYFTPFFDVGKLAWSPEFVEPICPLSWLPETAWATEMAGVVTAKASEETGIPAGTPVAVGTADAASEAVSAGALEAGDLMIMYGTTMFLIQAVAGYRRHRDLWASVYLQPGQAALAAGMSTSGALIRWFRDQFGQPEQEAEARGEGNAYQLLSESVAQIPAGSDGLIALPYFSGERTPINDPQARGALFGFTLKHTRAHVYRSCLEGIAYGLRHNIETMAEVDAMPERLVAVSSGVRNSLWVQICSDVTGLPQQVSEHTVGAAFGDAYLAGYAAGIFHDAQPLKDEWVKIARVVEPNPVVKPTYDALYAVYRSLYPHTRDDMHALAKLTNE